MNNCGKLQGNCIWPTTGHFEGDSEWM